MTYKRETPRRPIAWVLVADRARARIFESTWPVSNELTEVASLVHPEGQVHEQDVLTDAPGRFAETGGGPHYSEQHTDFRHRTAIDFANVVAERLEKGRVGNAFGHLVIVAPALFLGVLRNTLSSHLSKLVSHEITKDYTHLPVRELAPLLLQEPQPGEST